MDCRGPLKCVKLFNFRLVEITNPSMYVCANNIVSYAKFMDRVARSTDICAIHGFLRRVWIHRLRKQIHGYRRSTDCAQHRDCVLRVVRDIPFYIGRCLTHNAIRCTLARGTAAYVAAKRTGPRFRPGFVYTVVGRMPIPRKRQ